MTEAGPWSIEVHSRARRGLNRLPAKVATAIVEFITGSLADIPAQFSRPLTGELAGYLSARRGDYRVIIRLDEAAHTVLVARIDHRADVYRQS